MAESNLMGDSRDIGPRPLAPEVDVTTTDGAVFVLRALIAIGAVVALATNLVALADWARIWPGFMAATDPMCLQCVGP